MEKELHEQYEYARRRIKQKKRLYYHFVLFVLGSLLLFVAHKFLDSTVVTDWYLWIITIWLFLFILHFIKIFITDRFMNKDWEREQIDRLVTLQKKKMEQLQTQITNDELKQ
ncbi:2TM domain-containing protein [Flavobacterium petrolei]|jgi:TM2 domain-containing membrane protein YozV|uniref:2TM domain-containing protein n=1 Tax=Flavobacterium petrolei TaxID=2259594 RepID=A0A482TNB3_9FLAO|nr:2TM domain-containing protein [Flavobacterium petrolei]MDD2674055.1 2TM domain-containing protein [Flavobacterium sp.]RYJ53621.1 2TM domain-containing protein [Flavobacterium petrolei]